MSLYDDVRAILVAPEWEPVNVIDYGAFVTIAGRFNGVAHAGSRTDWEGLARDLDRIARERYEAGKAEAKPEPVAEPAPPAVDPRDAELAALRTRIAELESYNRIDLSERPPEEESPIPSPAVVALDAMEALKARMDAGRVHPELAALLTEGETPPDAIERLTPDEDALLNLGASLSEEALGEALRAIPRSAREKWMEGLHGTHADLRLKRGTDKENLQREAQVTRMMTLLGRVGEKR